MNNSQLHKVYQLAMHEFKSRQSNFYDPELWHIVCILNAYKAVWQQENPGQPLDFVEMFRQAYASVDDI